MTSVSSARRTGAFTATRSAWNEISSSARQRRWSHGNEIHRCELEVRSDRCRLCVLQSADQETLRPRLIDESHIPQSVVFRCSCCGRDESNHRRKTCRLLPLTVVTSAGSRSDLCVILRRNSLHGRGNIARFCVLNTAKKRKSHPMRSTTSPSLIRNRR